MSAEILRRAAALMRERAEAAQQVTLHAPWMVDGDQITGGDGQWMLVATAADRPTGAIEDSICAEHIASWHPAVALAVADLLDRQARMCEEFQIDEDDDHAALAVANAYLQETP